MRIESFLQLQSFEDFKTIGNKLIEIKDFPNWFWDYSDIPFNYNMIPDYCKLTNEYRMRFITIEFDDDVVAFCFKVIQIIKTKQIKLFEVPFSLNHNNNNVKIILSHLSKTLKEQFILLSNIYKVGSLDKENCNYYYNYNYYKKRVTPKYRRQHRFKRYENNFTLKIAESLDESLKKEFIQIHDVWYKLKKNPASEKTFLKAMTVKNKNYFYYIGYLHEIPCICGIAIITKFGIYIIFEYSLDRTNILYDTIVIYCSKILTEQLFNSYSNINLYKLGARKQEKGLLDFKERTSEDKIESYRINIKELLELYDKT